MAATEIAAGGRRGPIGFIERLGGMLVAPRATLDTVVQGGPGGIGDLIWLLVLQVVSVQLPDLVLAAVIMLRQSYSSGMSLLLNTVAGSAWMPLAAAIVGTVAIGPFTRERPGRERSLDLCGLCAVPAVELQLLASLGMAVARVRPPPWIALGVLAAGGIWFLRLLLLVTRMLRGTPAEPRR